ncbi:MAG: flagellar hook protein FlgE [Janthinobacterium lividum]
MSLFGALNTAVSGLTAQSAAFTNISDNVANSQTIGFKGVNTSFIDYLSSSTAQENQSGSVATRPAYQNNVQGAIESSSDTTALAISGQGFFQVSTQSGTTTAGVPILNATPEYTRTGDFTVDKAGYMVNSAGGFLNGWPVDAGGNVIQGALTPVRIDKSQNPPVATANVVVASNLPKGGTTSDTTQVTGYDTAGATHILALTWAPVGGASTDWTLSVAQDGGASNNVGTASFNPNGTIAGFTPSGGGAPLTGAATGEQGVSVTTTWGPVALNLGTAGKSDGVTQFAGLPYASRSITADGVTAGNYTGVAIQSDGSVTATYDNGTTRTLAQVPVVTFANANGLQRQNGEAFTVSAASGQALVNVQNANGAGSLDVGSTEDSNVDIATQLTKLIVAQQAYGANAKVITAANQLLTTTINTIQ